MIQNMRRILLLSAFIFVVTITGARAESPSETLKSAYLAANKYDFAKVETYLASEAQAKLKTLPETSLFMIREGWLEITRNGRIQAIDLLKEDIKGNTATVALRLHYKNGSTADYEDIVTMEASGWKISILPVLKYVATIGIQATQAVGQLENAQKQLRTKADIRAACTSIEAFSVDSNHYPSGKTGRLADLVTSVEPKYIKKLPLIDGWGNEFKYYLATDQGPYWIISYGADGKPEAGIYDSKGIPLPNATGKTSEPAADIILSNGSFLREPQELKPAIKQETTAAAEKLLPAEIIKTAYLAASDYDFPRANSFLQSAIMASIQKQTGPLADYVVKQMWQQTTKEGKLQEIEILKQKTTASKITISVRQHFSDGTTRDANEYLVLENSSWKIGFPSTILKAVAIKLGRDPKEVERMEKEEESGIADLRQTRRVIESLGTKIDLNSLDGYAVVPDGNLQKTKLVLSEQPHKDVWGNELKYFCLNPNGPYWIVSYGSDGKPDAGIYEPNGLPKERLFKLTTSSSEDFVYSSNGFVREPVSVLEADAYEKGKLDTHLYFAARTGFVAKIRKLVELGVDINHTDYAQTTPLMYAAESGSAEAVKILIDAGAKVNVKDFLDRTPLHHAVDKGEIETARVLLQAGAEVNAKDKNGDTPLSSAIRQKKTDLVQLLSGQAEAVPPPADPKKDAAAAWRAEHEPDIKASEVIVGELKGLIARIASGAAGIPGSEVVAHPLMDSKGNIQIAAAILTPPSLERFEVGFQLIDSKGGMADYVEVSAVKEKGKIETVEAMLQAVSGEFDLVIGIVSNKIADGTVSGRKIHVVVPAYDKEFAVSEIIAVKDFEQLPHASTEGHPYIFGKIRIHPSMDLVFPHDGNLVLFYEIYNFGVDSNGKENLEASFEFVGGKSQKSPPAAPVGFVVGRKMMVPVSYPLQTFPPGTFRIILTVNDKIKQQSATKSIVIEIQ